MAQFDPQPLPKHRIVQAFTKANHSIGADQAMAALQSWRDAMQRMNLDSVDSLYHERGVLLGTLADQSARDSEGRKSYFTKLFEGQQALQIDFDDTADIQLFAETATVSGHYMFMLTSEDGVEISLPARFDFTYCRDEQGDIKITLHHSSKNPQLEPTMRTATNMRVADGVDAQAATL